MAKGRFISKEICLDKKVNGLSDGYSMVGFTWLITHADCEGRIYGDPAIVKSLIFPRRMDVTVEMVNGYIQEWETTGLIKTYEVNSDIYIQFPNFDKHQVGLRKEREPHSPIPANDGKMRNSSGKNPQSSGKNRVNVNVKLIDKVNVNENVEVNGKSDDDNPLVLTFSKYTSLPAGKGALEIAQDLQTQGVKSEDIIKAIDFLRESPTYKCTSFKSVQDAARVEMSKRLHPGKKKVDPEDPRRYLKGEYGEFGSH